MTVFIPLPSFRLSFQAGFECFLSTRIRSPAMFFPNRRRNSAPSAPPHRLGSRVGMLPSREALPGRKSGAQGAPFGGVHRCRRWPDADRSAAFRPDRGGGIGPLVPSNPARCAEAGRMSKKVNSCSLENHPQPFCHQPGPRLAGTVGRRRPGPRREICPALLAVAASPARLSGSTTRGIQRRGNHPYCHGFVTLSDRRGCRSENKKTNINVIKEE